MAEAQEQPENKKHISDRLHGALHRGGKKATEDKAPAAGEAAAPADEAAAATATEAELEAVAEVVLVVVAELVAEMVELIADLEVRVAALELG
jgi:hypothetical protein